LAVVLFDHQGSAERYLPSYVEALVDVGSVDVEPVLVRRGHTVAPETFADLDGIAVAGGPTPDYLAGLSHAGPAIRAAVTSGVPYLGFSAGAMIAPGNALIGGYQLAGHDVCPREASEGLDTITVCPGLGLVPFGVDVHTAQAGTLGRAIAVVEAGEAAAAVGIDEDTCLILSSPSASLEECSVTGSGTVWIVNPGTTPGPVVVSQARAA
jgi:cyanophycinase